MIDNWRVNLADQWCTAGLAPRLPHCALASPGHVWPVSNVPSKSVTFDAVVPVPHTLAVYLSGLLGTVPAAITSEERNAATSAQPALWELEVSTLSVAGSASRVDGADCLVAVGVLIVCVCVQGCNECSFLSAALILWSR